MSWGLLHCDIFDWPPGLFYVIEGFLDILLPAEKRGDSDGKSKTPAAPFGEQLFHTNSGPSTGNSRSGNFDAPRQSAPRDRKTYTQKPLFTVRPGGIAGYLCKSASSDKCPFLNNAHQLHFVRSLHMLTSLPRRIPTWGSYPLLRLIGYSRNVPSSSSPLPSDLYLCYRQSVCRSTKRARLHT